MADNDQPDYRDTLNLPRTDFPMRARLPEREPETLARWEREESHRRLRAARAGRPKYVLHDGPPYANGHLHLGTAVNKIQKDFIVRSRTMMGYDAPYVPGWDCHGMPIEINVQREFQEADQVPGLVEIRRRCREYAAEWIDVQRTEFQRLGGWGEWGDPYLTMSNEYEAEIVEAFGDLVEQGYVYRGLRPIHWCISCQTALAEAEIEYKDKRSPSITVRLPLLEDPNGVYPGDRDPGGILIWTTTPWTIPANRAVVVHPGLMYSFVDTEHGVVVYAHGRHEELKGLFERSEIIKSVLGSELEGLVFRRPIDDGPSPLLLAEHATLDEGTGVVHTAPGHGAEDFAVGQAEGIEIYNPVGPDGVFVDGTPEFAGIEVWEANPRVVNHLAEAGLLLSSGGVEHAYPHCWRCKNPVIFRATVQWFLSLDHNDLRNRALSEIREVEWIPRGTIKRISTMVEQRPDWCLSRQRAWGVGIPAVYCEGCEEALLDAGFIRHVASRVRDEGADLWFSLDIEDLVPEGTHCEHCGPKATRFRREVEILDVWFDSGASQRAVLEHRDELHWPAELYIEGPDQHRGWFNSSLILAMATRGASPYRAVITHGWMVDADGRAMHKSLGNVISPQDVVEQRGADILRLWAAANEMTRDGRFSWEAIDQVSESYRRIRNTLRFLLGNLAGFEADGDLLAIEDLAPFDRWAVADLERMSETVRAAYERYEFHAVYQMLVNYCTVNLSSVYLDGAKVRLYTRPPRSVERRGAQTVLHLVFESLVRWLAPILPFTAEEAWRARRDRQTGESVHQLEFREPSPQWRDESLESDWETLLDARQAVTRELERLRERKEIGSSLAAEVEIAAMEPAHQAVLVKYAEDLDEVFIVSTATVRVASDEIEGDVKRSEEGFALSVRPSEAPKCARCWRYLPDVGDEPQHPGLCAECVTAIT